MEINYMKEIIKMVKLKEKEYNIMKIKIKDMKENIKLIIGKEKE